MPDHDRVLTAPQVARADLQSGRAGILALGAVLTSYVLLSLLTFDQMEEDAFIYFRVAANLADGYGYVFNRGGEALELGSSALWLALLVLLTKLPLDIVLAAKLLGIVIGMLSLMLVYRLSAEFISDPVLRFAPVLMTGWSVPFVMWNQRGLETALYSLVVLGLVFVCVERDRFRYWWPLAIVLLLARPESFVVLLALLPPLYFFGRPARELRSLAIVGVAALTMLAVRFFYFDDILPQPFYVKMRFEVASGLENAHRFIVDSYLYFLFVPALFAVWKKSYWTAPRMILLAFALALVSWYVLAKGAQPYNRHLVPAIPVLFLFLGSALDGLAARGRRISRPLVIVIGLAFLFASSFFSHSFHPVSRKELPNPLAEEMAQFARSPRAFLSGLGGRIASPETVGTSYQSRVGEFVRLNYPEGAVIVFDQMGKAPYRAGQDKVFIDDTGLTDRTVGRFYFSQRAPHSPILRLICNVLPRIGALGCSDRGAAQSTRDALDYIFGKRPDVILINDFVVRRFPGSLPARLAADDRLATLYQPRYVLAKIIRVYERSGTPKLRARVPEGLSIEPF